MTTRDTIRDWLEAGHRAGATHMIVVCDTFDHEDYPVYVGEKEDAREKASLYAQKGMQKIMEVYNYALDINAQLESDHRVRNF